MKLVGNTAGEAVNVLNTETQKQREGGDRKSVNFMWQLWAGTRARQLPRSWKNMQRCKKINHFAAVCRGKKKRTPATVRAVEESDTDETD